MKSKLKKLAMRYLTLLLIISVIAAPVRVSAIESAQPDTASAEQVTGGVAWTLIDGVLTISPATTPEEGYASGQMRTDYENSSAKGVPWFDNMKTITTLIVENDVTNLGNRVCNGASALTSVSLPSGLTSIGSRCFSDCSSLPGISLPSSISVISDTAFNGCTSLTVVDLSHTQITALDKKIFSACPGLTTITLPRITAIGESCFGASSGVKTNNLKRVNFGGTGSEWSAITVTTTGSGSGQTYNTQLRSCVLYCTDGLYTVDSSYDAVAYALDGYTAVSGYPLAWKVVDNTLYLLGRGATPAFTVADGNVSSAPWASFADAITAVVIDGEITSIGDNALYGCDSITYTYTGDFDTLKANSSKVGNEALFGEDVPVQEEQVDGGVAWTLVDGVLTIWPATTPEEGYTSGQMRTDYENNSANGVPWFDDMGTITTLVVKNGVTNLANRVCNGASSLTSVSLPNSLTSIGERSFISCTALAQISLPSSLTYLGPYAFTSCKELTVVDISNTQITSLGTKAFAGCEKLTTLSIPGTVTSIADNAFGIQSKKPTNLITRINYGGTLAAWNNGAFVSATGNTNLTNGTCTVYCTDGIWASGYTSSGANMCYKLAGGTLTIRCDGAMPDYAQGAAPWYTDVAGITNVVLENGITSVGANAFYNCNTLSYTYGGDFEALKAASSEVGNEALFGEGDPGEDPVPTETVTGGVAWTLVDGVLTISPATTPEEGYTSGQMRTDYTATTGTNPVPWAGQMETITSLVVESGVTNLAPRVCAGAANLTSVTLPEGITAIGSRCFSDCASLATISIPNSVEFLGDVVFNACTSLVEVDLSKTKITALDRKAFAACPELTTLHLPATVTSIADKAFGSTGINGVTVVTSNLKDLYYGGTMKDWEEINILVTSENTALTGGTCTVHCSDGLWRVGYNCPGGNLLYKLDDGTLTILCDGAMADFAEGAAPWFADAATITEVVIASGATTIGDNAFDGCVNMTDVTICETMSKVGENAFADCAQLANAQFYGTDAQWTALVEASEDGNDPLFGLIVSTGYSGKCGDNARWEYDPATKTLTISGTGPMWDWNQRTYENTPWSRFGDEIETIKIGYGITNTGRYAFCYLSSLKNLEFLTNEDGFTTVETIGGYCFCWHNQLTTLRLPEGVRFIAGRAFSRCESVSTLYLPSTLESIDMYAFQSADSAVVINKVYYNGTKEDWDRRVYVSTQGDGHDQLYSKNTQWVYLKDYTYYDDVSDLSWYADAVYYLKDQGMAPESGSFGVDEAATMQWVLNALYIRSGSSGAYTDALDWAKVKSVVDRTATMTDEITLDSLADILYRTTLYNGHVVDLGEGTALAWCRSYIPAELADTAADKALTRAEAASVLAAYLQSENGKANRYDEMREDMKAAYETTGGDGKMHILALQHNGRGKFGDCTLILLPNGETMLVDTFRSDGWEKYLKATLDTLGVKKLDYLVLSHGHEDHDANLSNIVNYIYDNGYSIGNYWSAGSTTSAREKAAIALLQEKGGVNIQNRLRVGQQLTIGSGSNAVTVDILWPMESGKGYNGSETNDGSLTMKLTYGNSSYICGGDLFLTAEEDILNLHKDNLDILKADVMKTNHHGSYSSNGSDWVAAIDPIVMITYSDDTGDSSQCYEYSLDGRAWFSAGRDGGVLITMDNEKNITITTGYDNNLRQNIYACGEKGHIYEGQPYEFDENGHWRRCEGFWLCGAMEAVLSHSGGTATCQHGKICETCGFEYTEKGNHNWTYSADGNVITASCGTCQTPGGTLTLTVAEEAPIYDGVAKTVTISGSIDNVDTPEVTYVGDRVSAGTFTAELQLEDAKAELTVTIGKRNAAITAKDQTVSYGSPISGTEFTATGLLEGHSVTVTLTPSTGDVTADGKITAKAAVLTADGADVTANYEIRYADGKLVIEPDTSRLEGLTAANVTSANQADILAVQEMMSNAESVKEEWKAIATTCEELIAAIAEAQAAINTENTEKVETVTAENVNTADQEALTEAKADLEKALSDNAGNYTQEEKQSIQEDIRRIEAALEALEKVGNVTDSIAQLPKSVEPDDEETAEKILAAKEAYNALTDHEKSLVDTAAKKQLDDLVAALTAYDIVKGDGGKWTQGSDGSLSFTANGPFSKFVGIEVDGKEVDAKNYTAKSGSTVITLKGSYLEALSVGTHTITVVYTDGETDGSFQIAAKTNSPATGDDFNVMLWTAAMLLSVVGMALLIGFRRSFSYKGKYSR